MRKKGILLVNLGTPDSPSTADVRKYLDEFLMDGRVIDIPAWKRALLVKGIIVPVRGPKSAKLYREIWTENGSPLLWYSLRQKSLVQECLGDDYQVELAMRYQSPSIETALANLKAGMVESIRVIPLFPQYASASTGSVMEKVMNLLGQWPTVPPVSFVNSFHDLEPMIDTFAKNAAKYDPASFDHILFSFHGLPQRQLKACDHTGNWCLKREDCCQTLTDVNRFCYSAQSHDTARLIAGRLGLAADRYSVCFQSRLGSDPWVQPYTSEVIKTLAGKGMKRLLVLCPAFVADCLETVYEVTVEYHEEFRSLGGELVQLVESVNDDPTWIEGLAGLARG